ncbi:MAG TPA: hypothetical protein VF650_03835 [Allosphingosinicella sp.]|jgi:putative transposase
MNERHLLACARYVEPNPVRAGIVAKAADWPWSSARAHLGGRADALTDPRPLLERWPDWRSVLEAGEDEPAQQAIRARERSGRPLGSDSFLAGLETVTELRLLPRRRGRPPARPIESTPWKLVPGTI